MLLYVEVLSSQGTSDLPRKWMWLHEGHVYMQAGI